MCLKSIININKDFVFIPSWMRNVLGDVDISDFEKYCGTDHVHTIQGDKIPADDTVDMCENLSWDEKEIENCCYDTYGNPEVNQVALCNPTNYVKTLSLSKLIAFICVLEKFVQNNGAIRLGEQTILNYDELSEAIKNIKQVFPGYLFITEEFVDAINKSHHKKELKTIIKDFEAIGGPVYKGDVIRSDTKKDLYRKNVYSKLKIKDDFIKENYDVNGVKKADWVMGWELTSYIVNYTVPRKQLSHTLKMFFEYGGFVIYDKWCYTKYKDLIEILRIRKIIN